MPTTSRTTRMAQTLRRAKAAIQEKPCTLNARQLTALRDLDAIADELDEAAAFFADLMEGQASTPAPLEHA